jgi:hypothetical protein
MVNKIVFLLYRKGIACIEQDMWKACAWFMRIKKKTLRCV